MSLPEMDKPLKDAGETWNGVDIVDISRRLGIENRLQRVTIPFPDDTDNLWIIANHQFQDDRKGELLPNTGYGLTDEYEVARDAVSLGYEVERYFPVGTLEGTFDVVKICANASNGFGEWNIEKRSSSNCTANPICPNLTKPAN
jgi:hypothetical protein